MNCCNQFENVHMKKERSGLLLLLLSSEIEKLSAAVLAVNQTLMHPPTAGAPIEHCSFLAM